MPERKQKQPPRSEPFPGRSTPSDGGPSAPKVEKPDTSGILKKLRKVGQDQAKRYRQRSGE